MSKCSGESSKKKLKYEIKGHEALKAKKKKKTTNTQPKANPNQSEIQADRNLHVFRTYPQNKILFLDMGTSNLLRSYSVGCTKT